MNCLLDVRDKFAITFCGVVFGESVQRLECFGRIWNLLLHNGLQHCEPKTEIVYVFG